MQTSECKKGIKLQNVCRDIILHQKIGSQRLLVEEVRSRGIEQVNQSRVSKVLDRIGAVKLRDDKGNFYYGLVDNLTISCKEQTFESVVLAVTYNKHHILVKTIKGGGAAIAQIIEGIAGEMSIMGCFSNESSVLVIPNDTDNIFNTVESLERYFKLPSRTAA